MKLHLSALIFILLLPSIGFSSQARASVDNLKVVGKCRLGAGDLTSSKIESGESYLYYFRDTEKFTSWNDASLTNPQASLLFVAFGLSTEGDDLTDRSVPDNDVLDIYPAFATQPSKAGPSSLDFNFQGKDGRIRRYGTTVYKRNMKLFVALGTNPLNGTAYPVCYYWLD